MVDAVLPQFESRAGEQLYGLASQTLQLLSMLEVVQYSIAHDGTYIVELAGAMEAFAVRIGETELMLPLDRGRRSRESLQASITKARALYRSALHMAKVSPTELASVHTLIALALNRLAAICQQLREAVHKHDHAFECNDVPDGQQALG